MMMIDEWRGEEAGVKGGVALDRPTFTLPRPSLQV